MEDKFDRGLAEWVPADRFERRGQQLYRDRLRSRKLPGWGCRSSNRALSCGDGIEVLRHDQICNEPGWNLWDCFKGTVEGTALFRYRFCSAQEHPGRREGKFPDSCRSIQSIQ